MSISRYGQRGRFIDGSLKMYKDLFWDVSAFHRNNLHCLDDLFGWYINQFPVCLFNFGYQPHYLLSLQTSTILYTIPDTLVHRYQPIN